MAIFFRNLRRRQPPSQFCLMCVIYKRIAFKIRFTTYSLHCNVMLNICNVHKIEFEVESEARKIWWLVIYKLKWRGEFQSWSERGERGRKFEVIWWRVPDSWSGRSDTTRSECIETRFNKKVCGRRSKWSFWSASVKERWRMGRGGVMQVAID